MKKLIIVLVLLLAATALFGQSIRVPSNMVGKWLDSISNSEFDYEAVWEFSTNGLKVSGSDGEFNFAGKTIRDFNGISEGIQVGISFSCVESERSYKFLTALPSTDIVMTIDRAGLPTYTIRMKKQ
jgi:hypothetical protein